tara:strand:+ start:8635 stop:8874 length:240 start_codon:yes stop_codon:yes gene_type:complete
LLKKGSWKISCWRRGTPPTPPKDGVVRRFFYTKLEKIHAGKMEKAERIDCRERSVLDSIMKELGEMYKKNLRELRADFL